MIVDYILSYLSKSFLFNINYPIACLLVQFGPCTSVLFKPPMLILTRKPVFVETVRFMSISTLLTLSVLFEIFALELFIFF